MNWAKGQLMLDQESGQGPINELGRSMKTLLRDVVLLKAMSAAGARSIAGGATSVVTGNIA